MFVVTTQADGHPSGCLVGFATQTSMHPPRFLAGLSRNNHTCGVAARSDYLAVHVLERRHIGLAQLFGGETGDQINKFALCSWHTGPEGMPILDDAVAWFIGGEMLRAVAFPLGFLVFMVPFPMLLTDKVLPRLG